MELVYGCGVTTKPTLYTLSGAVIFESVKVWDSLVCLRHGLTGYVSNM
jgi:hypothetical protein